MLIGVDFDNTIVCYDKLFHQLALERSLIPPLIAGQQGNGARLPPRTGSRGSLDRIAGLRLRAAHPRSGSIPWRDGFFPDVSKLGGSHLCDKS